MKCVVYRFFYNIPLVKRWQAIYHHFSKCPKCREQFFAPDSVRPVGITPGKVEVPAEVWINIKKRIEEIQQPGLIDNKAKKKIGPTLWGFKWKWAAIAVVILFLLLPFIIPWKGTDNIKKEKTIVVQNREIVIQSIKVENQPAKVVYYQPRSKNRLIIWIKK